MNVISCSRRTDIPHWHSPWLAAVLERGEVGFKSPRGLERRVSLTTESVHSMVLWSKDYGPLLQHSGLLAQLQSRNPFFHFTITGLGAGAWEPEAPAWPQALEQMNLLVKRFGPERINWRFDPIVHWWDNGAVASNHQLFIEVGSAVAALGVSSCTFSFAHWYRKSQRRLSQTGFSFCDLTPAERLDQAAELAAWSQSLGLKLASCSDPLSAAVEGIAPARCIDGARLTELRGTGPAAPLAKDSGQRPACGCTKSIDIGSYTQACGRHACLYCYAG